MMGEPKGVQAGANGNAEKRAEQPRARAQKPLSFDDQLRKTLEEIQATPAFSKELGKVNRREKRFSELVHEVLIACKASVILGKASVEEFKKFYFLTIAFFGRLDYPNAEAREAIEKMRVELSRRKTKKLAIADARAMYAEFCALVKGRPFPAEVYMEDNEKLRELASKDEVERLQAMLYALMLRILEAPAKKTVKQAMRKIIEDDDEIANLERQRKAEHLAENGKKRIDLWMEEMKQGIMEKRVLLAKVLKAALVRKIESPGELDKAIDWTARYLNSRGVEVKREELVQLVRTSPTLAKLLARPAQTTTETTAQTPPAPTNPTRSPPVPREAPPAQTPSTPTNQTRSPPRAPARDALHATTATKTAAPPTATPATLNQAPPRKAPPTPAHAASTTALRNAPRTVAQVSPATAVSLAATQATGAAGIGSRIIERNGAEWMPASGERTPFPERGSETRAALDGVRRVVKEVFGGKERQLSEGGATGLFTEAVSMLEQEKIRGATWGMLMQSVVRCIPNSDAGLLENELRAVKEDLAARLNRIK